MPFASPRRRFLALVILTAAIILVVIGLSAGALRTTASAEISAPLGIDAQSLSVVPEVVKPGAPAKVVLHLPSLANAHEVYLHYGFNGWNVPLSGEGAGQSTDTGNTNYFRQSVMTLNQMTGSYELSIDVPANARALHFVVCWDACGNGQWDNNNGHDYSWPITFPYIGPVLSWNDATPPDTGMVVSFIHSVATAAWLRYGATGDQIGVLVSDATTAERHTFALTGLKANTTYWYQVGTDDQLTSARYQFHTAKPQSAITDVSFAVYGDAQDNGETGSFAQTVNELVTHHQDLDLLLVTGDMPWNDNPADWWSYFDLARPLLATKVVMPALGNHDTPTVDSNPDQTSFEHFFALPRPRGDGYYYAFTFGPARFFALDSEHMVDFSSPSGAQLNWLRGELEQRRAEVKASSTPQWTFTYWHIPPFNAGTRHWSQQFNFRAPTRDFDGIVDWNFNGHEHLGQRFLPLAVNGDTPVHVDAYGVGDGKGIGNLIVPAAGAVPEDGLLANDASNGNIRDLLAFPASNAGNQIAPFNGFARVDIRNGDIKVQIIGASRSGNDASRGFYGRDEVHYQK